MQVRQLSAVLTVALLQTALAALQVVLVPWPKYGSRLAKTLLILLFQLCEFLPTAHPAQHHEL